MPDPVTPDEATAALNQQLAALTAELNKLAPVKDIAAALDEDPAAIYRIRAALDGTTPPAHQTQAPQPQSQQLTREQLEQLRERYDEDPLGTASALGTLAAQQEFAKLMGQARPIIEATADNYVELYKSKKAGSDKLYSKIEANFDKQLKGVDRQALIGMEPDERQRFLDLRYEAAASSVFRKAMAEAPPPQNMGAGGSSAQPAGPKSIFQKNAVVSGLAARFISEGLLTEDDVNAIDKQITSGDDEDDE